MKLVVLDLTPVEAETITNALTDKRARIEAGSGDQCGKLGIDGLDVLIKYVNQQRGVKTPPVLGPPLASDLEEKQLVPA